MYDPVKSLLTVVFEESAQVTCILKFGLGIVAGACRHLCTCLCVSGRLSVCV